MGAYLSSPVTEKVSSHGKCDLFVYGASSMQGWRMSQEDAHNCLVDFDKDTRTSLFAVYDGHGGSEVAQYTAAHFPDFLKSSEHYAGSDLQKALEEGFLDFDTTLTEDSVIKELKEIAGLDDDEAEEDEVCMPAGVGRNEADVLRAEANMPLEELLEKYDNYTGKPLQVKNVMKKEQILSPVLRSKKQPIQRQRESILSEADSNSNSLTDWNENANQSNSISSICSFDQKIANGCADNENNLNFEKEFMEKNKAESSDVKESECNEAISLSCNQDVYALKSEIKPAVTSSSDSRNDNLDISHDNMSEEQVSSSSSINSGSLDSRNQCGPSCSNDLVNSHSCSTTDCRDIKNEQIPSSSSVSDIAISDHSVNNSLPSSSASHDRNGHQETSDVGSLINPSAAEGRSCSSGSTCEGVSETEPSCSSAPVSFISSESKPNGTDAEPSCSEVVPSGSSEPGQPDNSESKPCVSELQPSGSTGHVNSHSSECGSTSYSDLGEEAMAGSSGQSSSHQTAACNSQDEEPCSSGSGKPEFSKPSRSLEEDSDESIDDDDDDYEDSEDYVDESDEDDDEEEEEDIGDETEEVEDNMYSTDEPGSDSGCTAVVALIRDRQLIVANAGDSRCVLSRKGDAVDLSVDHKPEDERERKRIEAAGGNVTLEGRVNGGLNLSRAIGDHCYKQNTEKSSKEQMITALPDIESCMLEETDEFVVIACDGIWNYMSSQEVVDYVRERLKDPKKRDNPALICEELFDHCLAPNTTGDGTGCDNMTCIILTFHKHLESNLFDTLKRKAEDPEMNPQSEDHPEKKSKLSDS